jgi:hypothetical protein
LVTERSDHGEVLAVAGDAAGRRLAIEAAQPLQQSTAQRVGLLDHSTVAAGRVEGEEPRHQRVWLHRQGQRWVELPEQPRADRVPALPFGGGQQQFDRRRRVVAVGGGGGEQGVGGGAEIVGALRGSGAADQRHPGQDRAVRKVLRTGHWRRGCSGAHHLPTSLPRFSITTTCRAA